MSHRTLVNGTAYEITGGRTLINGTGYDITKGRTLVDGTGYDISLEDETNYAAWLKTDGKSYIDTKIKPNNNTRVVMNVEVLSTQSGEGHFASCTGDGYYFTLYRSSAKTLGTRYGTQEYQVLGTVATGTHCTLDKNKNVTTFNGDSVTHTAETFQMNYTLSLFCRNAAGTMARYIQVKFYSCQIYDNDMLVRDFWPCYDPDGVACLYDKVEREYYYNAGSGEFVAGTGSEEETPTVISFTIFGTSYTAEEGMTWAEWVASIYNTAGFSFYDDYLYLGNEGPVGYSNTGDNVKPTEEIIANTSYNEVGA